MSLYNFTPMQEYGYNILCTGHNVFLTGDAGTGKSYLLNKYIEHLQAIDKNVVVTAPTGIAALNINGATIHRTFGLGINPLVSSKITARVPDVIKEADAFIIDEISMCRVDLFTYVAKMILKANEERKRYNKKSIQVILCGDFFQLPPVMNNYDREVLTEFFGSDIGYGFAFQSHHWQSFNFVNIVLKDVVRQQDSNFASVLNAARIGNKRVLNYIKAYSNPYYLNNAIILSGTNKAVNEKNYEELSKIDSKLVEYEAKIIGDVKESDKVTSDNLQLKVGARVMTLVNDIDDLYRNGSFGTVTELNKDNVVVMMDAGYTVKIFKYTWEIIKYSLDNGKLKQEIVGKFIQYPLKLAWAITIHKSQGQTYDAVNLNPYCWDAGQLYTALSRVKSLDQMHLTSYLLDKYLVTSETVKQFYANL